MSRKYVREVTSVKQEYEKPTIEIMEFKIEEITCTSGVVIPIDGADSVDY
jgi:hypothetical protein